MHTPIFNRLLHWISSVAELWMAVTLSKLLTRTGNYWFVVLPPISLALTQPAILLTYIYIYMFTLGLCCRRLEFFVDTNEGELAAFCSYALTFPKSFFALIDT